MHRLSRAVAASFFPLVLPFCSKSTKAGIAPDAPIITLFSSATHKLKRVAAAFSLASSSEDLGNGRNGTIKHNTRLVIFKYGKIKNRSRCMFLC
ncbi:hypothetical protein V6N13_108202 [Hibiscus sabdariffa]